MNVTDRQMTDRRATSYSERETRKIEWWGAGVIICLERGWNDLHMVQLMPLPPHCLLLH